MGSGEPGPQAFFRGKRNDGSPVPLPYHCLKVLLPRVSEKYPIFHMWSHESDTEEAISGMENLSSEFQAGLQQPTKTIRLEELRERLAWRTGGVCLGLH